MERPKKCLQNDANSVLIHLRLSEKNDKFYCMRFSFCRAYINLWENLQKNKIGLLNFVLNMCLDPQYF